MLFQGPNPEKLYEVFDNLNLSHGAHITYTNPNISPVLGELSLPRSVAIVSLQDNPDSDYGLIEVYGNPLQRNPRPDSLLTHMDYYLFPAIDQVGAATKVSFEGDADTLRDADKNERRFGLHLLRNIVVQERINKHVQRRRERLIRLNNPHFG